MSDLEQKRALLRGLQIYVNVTGEAMIGNDSDYQQAGAKLMVWEMHLLEKDNNTERALLSRYHSKETRRFTICGTRA